MVKAGRLQIGDAAAKALELLLGFGHIDLRCPLEPAIVVHQICNAIPDID